MELGLAGLIVTAAGAYLALGVVFAVPFVLRWAARLDPAAGAGSAGFRVLIFPGAVLLWPVLLYKVVGAR